MASAATVPPGACLYALDTTADRAFQIAGAQSIYTACGVVVESSASDGFEMEGSETLYLQNHAQVSVVGGAQLNGQTKLWDTISNKQVQPVQVSSPGDPLASIAAPTSGTIVSKTPAHYDMNSKPANNTLSPGVYCGGLTIGNTNGTAFTMSPGIYIMAGGGLVLNSQAVVNGSGVTVYNTSSAGWGCSSSYNYTPVTISGQVTATLSAPTSGAFDGILFFGNRTGCSTKGSCVDQINGGSTTVLNGALYFASDEIQITGNSSTSGFMMLVADKIYINGNSTFGNNGNPFDGITVSVSPATTTLFSAQTQQFTAAVSNSANSAVTWTISPAGVGSISSTGLYTAPSPVTAQQTVIVTATSQADTSKSGTATVTLAVAKITPTITWATPAAITYGTAISAAQLDATASVPGTFVYTPTVGTVLAAGSRTLSVAFTPTNTTLYNTATASVTLTVNKATLTVTAANASRAYGAANPIFSDTITGFVNGDTSSVISGAPSLTTMATSTSAPGSYSITAAAGTLSAANYSFSFVAGTLTVTTAMQTINFPAPSSPVTYGVAPIALSATASSGLGVSFSVVSGPGTISGSTLTITGAGTVVVAANQAGNADYAAAAQVTQSVVVTQATPVITWATPAAITYGTALGATQLNATASVAGTFAYTPAAGAVLPAGSQTLSVTFTPTDTTDYSTVMATVTLTVNNAPVSVSVVPPSATLYASQTQQFTASVTNSNNQAVTWAYTENTNVINYPGSGFTATSLSLNGGATVTSGGLLQLTDGGGGEARSAWFTTEVPIQTFITDFTFQQLNAGADGMTFTIQGQGAVALGGSGGSLGYQGILTSIAVKFDLYNNAGEGSDSTGLYTNGAAPTVPAVDLSSTGINLHSGDVMDAHLVYDGANLTMTLTDTVTSASVTEVFPVNIPSIVGGNTAYVGFTGGTGGLTATQNVLSWTYNSSLNGSPTVTSSGSSLLFTAPATISTQQTVTITATSLADMSKSASATVTLMPPVSVSVTPPSATLYEGQSQQLTAAVTNATNTAVTWMISPAGVGTISSSGLYTAPASITTQQTMLVTAISAADTSKFAQTTITLMPAVSISVAPTIASLYGGWSQQFTASVANTSNTAVNWTINPAGTGTISSSGLYTAPATITSQQTVTITATSQADTTQSAAATITLTPTQCASSYQRTITIDHTKVPNTDQINFPFLFNTTDPAFASIANNGHISSSNGYDIVFSLDSSGVTKLDYELEQYNPATGQIIAWVRIPTLSHTSDTVLYMFYGNSSITTSQQNPVGVWDSNYLDVLHLDESSGTTVFDSTANGNNGTKLSPSSPTSVSTGEIGGAQSFNGTSDYIVLPPSMTSGLTVFSTSFWMNSNDNNSNSTYWNRPEFLGDATYGGSSRDFGVNTNNGYLGMWSGLNAASDNSLVSGDFVDDGNWHRIDAVNNGSFTVLYLDGQNTGQTLSSGLALDSYGWYLGAQHDQGAGAAFFHQGSLDEFRFSNSVRSADWIATEYSNQSLPAKFYALSAEGLDNTPRITPAAVNLYAAQYQQFALLGIGTCSSIVDNWTIEPAGVGTISQTGLYTAPGMILTQQAVTVTATTPENNNSVSAAVTLMPSSGGPAGTVVTINGTGFGSAEGASSVTVGGLPAVTLSWSDTQIQAQIPTGTGLGNQNVVVTVNGQVSATATFIVTPGLVGITPPPAGIAASSTIDTPNQTAPLIFSGTAGQLVSVMLTNFNYPGTWNSVNVSILKPDGSTLASTSMYAWGFFGSSLFQSPVTLPVTGIYTLLIAPQNGITGNTGIALYLFNNQTGTITSGNPKNVTINFPGQEDLLTFYGWTGQTASVQLSNFNFPVFWDWVDVRILNPDGTTLVSSSMCSAGGVGCNEYLSPVTLPAPGTYTLVIAPESGLTGSVTALLTLTTPEIVTMSAGLNPVESRLGNPVTVNVTLAGGAVPTGTVSCSGSGVNSSAVTVSSVGTAVVTMNGLPLGKDVIVCSYTSNNISAFLNAVSSSMTETVISPPATGSVSVTPASATLYGGQVQQFSASIFNISNQTVTWSISPSGTGTISATGLYAAPAKVGSQQTVTVTAISQADSTQSASAMITLSPPQCTSSGYSYQRSIVIDHTKVPNTDQTDFPFLFNTTDPILASIANGGHVSSPNGYDIIFSTDPGGLTKLDHELEQYNPVTGQVVAWVRIPTLSHTADTVLYVFYGNSNIVSSQQNPTGVWDSNYQAVYHLANAGTGTAADSTVNGNSATLVSISTAFGEIDGAGSFNGVSSYMQVPSADFLSYPTSGSTTTGFSATFGVWFQTSSDGVILGQTDGTEPGGNPGQWQPALYVDTAGLLRASLFSHGGVTNQIVTATAYNDNKWHFAVDTYTNGAEELYVDGQFAGSQQVAEVGYNSAYAYFVGAGETANWPAANGSWLYFNGVLDEVNISTIARSGDWVQTEYNNQSSPSTFYVLHPENAEEVNPATVSLYDSQSQQFTVLGSVAGMCNSPAVIWSMPSGMPGTLTASGIYTAPNSITSQQTVPITATILGDSTKSISATVTLMPAVSVSLTPGSVTLTSGQTQQFTANVANTGNTAVAWTMNPSGLGTINAAGLYTAPAILTTQETVTITVTSQADKTKSASATVTLSGTAPLVPVSISVTPSSTALYGDQTQQFTANVTNTYNTAVTWTISPANVGTISSSGLYTAPATITTQQTVTITATSQANTTQSASATIALSPTPCGANGYGYVRSIAIDHSKIPNSDQSNFPFLFNTTDPSFATTANGGHVTSSIGNDIIFSSDPNGSTTLNYELEAYNPVTGQIIAWVNIPTLSHSTDTVLYMFYGNSSITSPQQHPTGVWDSNYGGVWHLSGSGNLQSFPDSTANANTATVVGSVSAIPAPIGNGVAMGGGSNYIDAGDNPSVLPTHTGTFSIWAYYNAFSGNFTTLMGSGNVWGNSNGTLLWSYGGTLYFDVYGPSGGNGAQLGNLATGQWYYFTGTWDGSTVALYENGTLVSHTAQTTDASPAFHLTFGVDGAHSFDEGYLNGNLDEARVSGIARSADWIAAEYNNQRSPSSFFTVSSENGFFISPASVGLNASQSQQFTATSLCNSAVTWSMPGGSLGTLTPGGLYTAPSIITMPQTVTITASNQINSANSNTATVTLLPPVAVTVTPGSVMLTGDQTQQFIANVSNTNNTAVTWTVTPAGTGAISNDGVYTAPVSITTPQTVTITATSQEDITKSASATITLSPTQCASSGYAYQRIIVIDHTKIPNTDQTNFPFLFSTTDPDLAFTSNGGHVTNFSGDDIIFSTDPNGLTKLDHEMEKYNPLTGQMVAWVRIPTLSHTTDTVIFVFYGNPNITSTQQNPAGVWDSNYTAVYHLANTGTGVATDSSVSGNNGTLTSVSAASGEIDGAASLNGASSYIQIPEADFPNYPTGVYNNVGLPGTSDTTTFSTTVGAWFKTASAGGILNQSSSITCTSSILGICLSTGPMEPGDTPDNSSWDPMIYVDDNGRVNAGGIISPLAYNDNSWHYAVWTFATSGTEELYVDGQNVGSAQGVFPGGYSSDYAYFVGVDYTFQADNGNQSWQYFNGDIDEVTVSNTPRSGDWIQAEYNNQSSPFTFYTFKPARSALVVPSAISLYAAQSQQFATTIACNASVTWSMPSGAQGILTSSGLYTAPSSISIQQTVAITATNQASGSTIGSAVVSLLPPPLPITFSASAQSPYTTGSAQAFSATLLDQDGTPEPGVTVTFTVSGANSNIGSSATSSNGIATYTYTGVNSGSDTIQATAVVKGQLLTSNSISASWALPVPPTPAAKITLIAPPTLGQSGLIGAFTDSNGAVIEPIAIGAAPRVLVVPAGATQLQLGVDSAYYALDGGPGFVVAVNGTTMTVPATAMPWIWVTGGLNNNYQYGIYAPSIQNGILDGTNPVIAVTGLTQGESVSIVYQSGTASANYPISPLVNADGDQASITGVQLWKGTYFPTMYTTASSYPLNQPVTFNALVTDASGNPASNVSVTLNVTGANAQQLQATTDSTGMAAFMYYGSNPGTDSLQAQAFLSGTQSLASSQSSLTWISYPTPPPAGKLLLQLKEQLEDRQGYFVLATDASGNPVFNANTGFYVWGVDNFQVSGTTDITGQGFFNYYHGNNGTYNVVAVDSVNRNIVFSNAYNSQWTGLNSSSGGIITIGISANTTVTMPNTLQLNGSVTDSAGLTPAVFWNQISGPGNVTFANPNQAVTTAAFSDVGSYVLQLSASDATGNSGSVQWQVTVYPPLQDPQGWIGSPLYGSTVTGVIPITLAPGVTLQSGILTYYPANNTNNVTVLNANTTGSGQIGTLDTTTLTNGSYWIQLQATDASGGQQYGLVLVTVAGNYKPGRVTATVTDLVVPATGLAINIQRTYDSLNAGTSSDFGYGWSLGINVNLVVDNSGNVTFTLGGQRKTFYLTPTSPPCTLVGCLFPYYFVTYTPEPGLYGTLSDGGSGCFSASGLDIVVPDGSMWLCNGSSTLFNPTGYVYTDPNGTSYNISAAGNLQSIQDRSGNGLTITANGITSTTGLSVPFVRDASNRITQITDPQGNIYQYGYDQYGNLATVTYPNTTTPSTYTYDANHLYLSGTDARSNPLPVASYFTTSDTDPNGLPLKGRLQNVTDAFNNTTSYAYNLATNTTTITYPDQGTATMVYDNYGMLLNSTDPLNHTTTNVYDANHNLISTTDPLGHTTASTYDKNGNKTSSTYPATATSKNTTSYTYYNQYSEPTSTTDELGNVRTFNYDANYNPQNVTDSIGTLASFIFNPNQTLAAGAIGFDITSLPAMASQFTYDANGNMASRTDALGRTTSYVYNSLGQKTAMVAPTPTTLTGSSASTTTYQYDALGDLIQTAAPLSRTTSSTYDANGNKISSTDARGNTTTYQYDSLNRLIETDYPDGTKSTRTYDFRNNVVTATDQAGNVTLNAYDLAGRLTSVTRGYGSSTPSTTTYAYDNANRKISETDALGHTTSYTYDAAGRLTALSGVKGNFAYAYDDAGNRISQTDANNNTTQFQFDARKRLIKTLNPDNTTIVNTYDGPGNLASVTDQASHTVQYTYDAANQLKSVIQLNHPNPSANTNSYGYDPLGNLTGLTDENIHTTRNLYDVMNEPIQKTLPDQTLTETRSYDAAGNLVSLTHFNGVTTTYTYDALNRLLTRTTPGEAPVSFTYSATGKRATMSVGSWNTTYSYDTLDRLTTKAAPAGTLTYSYDGAGNLASMSSNHANGILVAYAWDELNRLSTVTDSRLVGNQVTTYTYDPASNVATVTAPNGLQTTLNYDLMNRLTSLSTPISSYTYTLGATGNRIGAVEGNGRTLNWNYDGIYRLTNETISNDPEKNNGSASYGLDPVGNRLSLNSSLPGIVSGSFGYNVDDEISSETYDANGNVLATNGTTYTYDSENHMTSANNGAVRMIYDGDGNRVAKIVGGVTTQYLVDDLNPTGLPQVVEEVVNGAVTRQYTYGLQRISQNLSPTVTGNSTWTPSFYVYDGGGSVRQLTNTTGAVTDEYEYDAYGHSFTKSGTTPNNYLYRGEQFDSDLGLYYLRARYYNPNTGRFMSRDPEDGKRKDPASFHKYLYANGDPLNRIDPRGRDSLIEYIKLQATVTAEVVTEWLVTKAVVAEEIFNECMEAQLAMVNLDPEVYSLAKAICMAVAYAVP
jgi:RHS repeat-associated protein